MIRFIYFDLGNTIVDYHSGPVTEKEKEELGLDLLRTRMARVGSPVSWERLVEEFYTPLTRDLLPMRVYNSREPDVEALISPLVKEKTVTPRELMDLFFEPVRKFARRNYDIGETLEELSKRGLEMGIISNTPIHGSSHDKTLKRLGIHSFFSQRLYSFDQGVRKPDKRLFLRAAELTGCDMGEIMMVGDNPGLDLDTPVSLGMKSLLFDPEGMHGIYGKYPSISRFREILDYLEESIA